MINQNQIKGEIGETLIDDINFLKNNSMKLTVLKDTENFVDVTTLTNVFTMSSKIDKVNNVILSGAFTIVNPSLTMGIPFEIYDESIKMFEGIINVDSIMSFNSDKIGLIVKIGGNCNVTYEIKYF